MVRQPCVSCGKAAKQRGGNGATRQWICDACLPQSVHRGTAVAPDKPIKPKKRTTRGGA